LYEIIPAGSKEQVSSTDALKYQQPATPSKTSHTNELLTVKFRYKKPDGNVSQLIEKTVMGSSLPLAKTSNNFRFAAAVAEFGMLLRESDYRGNASIPQVVTLATGAKGMDQEGYRVEFINLVKSSQFLQAKQ
jgi:Ca-activated chloride channel family protein